LTFAKCLFSQTNRQDKVDVSIACGIVGYSSPQIIELRKLDSLKDYKAIRDKLNGSNVDKLIAAVMLTEYVSKKKIILSKNETAKLKAIKTSQQRYSLCYSCTIHLEGTFAQVFSMNNAKYTPVFSPYDIIKENVLN
jgi:hypothetical protein